MHGEANEMSRLKAALQREYEDSTDYKMEVHNPRNTVAVELHFRGEKLAKVRPQTAQYVIITAASWGFLVRVDSHQPMQVVRGDLIDRCS